MKPPVWKTPKICKVCKTVHASPVQGKQNHSIPEMVTAIYCTWCSDTAPPIWTRKRARISGAVRS